MEKMQSIDKQAGNMIKEMKFLLSLEEEQLAKERQHQMEQSKLIQDINEYSKKITQTAEEKKKVDEQLIEIYKAKLEPETEYDIIERYHLLDDMAKNLFDMQYFEQCTLAFLKDQLQSHIKLQQVVHSKENVNEPKIKPQMTRNVMRLKREKDKAMRPERAHQKAEDWYAKHLEKKEEKKKTGPVFFKPNLDNNYKPLPPIMMKQTMESESKVPAGALNLKIAAVGCQKKDTGKSKKTEISACFQASQDKYVENQAHVEQRSMPTKSSLRKMQERRLLSRPRLEPIKIQKHEEPSRPRLESKQMHKHDNLIRPRLEPIKIQKHEEPSRSRLEPIKIQKHDELSQPRLEPIKIQKHDELSQPRLEPIKIQKHDELIQPRLEPIKIQKHEEPSQPRLESKEIYKLDNLSQPRLKPIKIQKQEEPSQPRLKPNKVQEHDKPRIPRLEPIKIQKHEEPSQPKPEQNKIQKHEKLTLPRLEPNQIQEHSDPTKRKVPEGRLLNRPRLEPNKIQKHDELILPRLEPNKIKEHDDPTKRKVPEGSLVSLPRLEPNKIQKHNKSAKRKPGSQRQGLPSVSQNRSVKKCKTTVIQNHVSRYDEELRR